MQRFDREVFGMDTADLMDIADVIFTSAYSEQSIKDTNDGVRTGAANTYTKNSWNLYNE